LFKSIWRLLSFRIQRDELDAFDRRHLLAALGLTWLVGIGRWWDDDGAKLLQKSGLGSVAYIFVLALVLYVVALPLRPRNWSYRHVLTFVGLTAPPALLYAIPVERFLSTPTAAQVNLWFLLVVAAWRVALLVFYMVRHAALSWWKVLAATLLPLASVVMALSFLNLTRGVVEIMGGLRGQTADDLANDIVLGLGMLSFLAFGPLALLYVVAVLAAWRGRRAPPPES